jgi:hypothetical protein
VQGLLSRATPPGTKEVRQHLLFVKQEEPFLVSTHLMHVNVIRAGPGAFFDGFDVRPGIRTAHDVWKSDSYWGTASLREGHAIIWKCGKLP